MLAQLSTQVRPKNAGSPQTQAENNKCMKKYKTY